MVRLEQLCKTVEKNQSRTGTALLPKTETSSQPRSVLLQEIAAVRRRLKCLERSFDFVWEDDLIDACIYQQNALAAQYRHLMAEARKQGVTALACERGG